MLRREWLYVTPEYEPPELINSTASNIGLTKNGCLLGKILV